MAINTIKRGTILLVLITCFAQLPTVAQNTFEEYRQQKRAEFNRYRNNKRETFEAYRAQKNKDFAEYLEKKWVHCKLNAGQPQAKKPDPVTPVVAPKEDDTPKTPVVHPFKNIISTPKPTAPKPIDFPTEPKKNTENKINFSFYGTQCKVYFVPEMTFRLTSVKEKDVAKAWKQLSDENYSLLLADCRKLHETMKLNDFGLFRLAEAVAQRVIGSCNESAVLQTYIMTQFGYDVRLCQQNNRLGLLVPFRQTVCNIPYYQFNGTNFYLWSENMRSESVESYPQNIKDATRIIDMNLAATPSFPLSPASTPQTYRSEKFPGMTAKVSANKPLMLFYHDYPMLNDWGFYAAQPMDPTLTHTLYKQLKPALQGKSETEATEMLLNFVQTAFKYQTDEQQFGREKYNFGEENFYYPACDCEDRSILFAHLVKDLVGLEVVLLHYPNHLATAVRFNHPVNGHCLDIKGQKYTICDPTYINAGIGMCMKKFIGVKPTVYLIPRSR